MRRKIELSNESRSAFACDWLNLGYRMMKFAILCAMLCLVAPASCAPPHPGQNPRHHNHHLSDKWSDEWIGKCVEAVRPKLNIENIIDPDPRFEFGNQLEQDEKEGKVNEKARIRRRLRTMKIEDMTPREKVLYYREKKHRRQKRRLDSSKQKRSKFIDGEEDKGKAEYVGRVLHACDTSGHPLPLRGDLAYLTIFHCVLLSALTYALSPTPVITLHIPHHTGITLIVSLCRLRGGAEMSKA